MSGRFVRDWALHPVYDDILVSDSGVILSYKKRSWYELHQSDNGSGYLRVAIGHGNPQYVHRLIAQTFVHNPDPITRVEVNHIDGNKYNNFVENLEWVTTSENGKHAFRIGLKVAKSRGVRIVETGEEFTSQRECAEHINGIQGNIALCLIGMRKRHRGYTFEYLDGETYV